MTHYKKTEQVHEPAKVVDKVVEDSIICDLCQAKTEKDGTHMETNWDADSYGIDAVHIDHMVGSSYPEGGDYKKTIFDVCSACFLSKIVPMLESMGLKSRSEDHDW